MGISASPFSLVCNTTFHLFALIQNQKWYIYDTHIDLSIVYTFKI